MYCFISNEKNYLFIGFFTSYNNNNGTKMKYLGSTCNTRGIV